jgi:hypothetical protein
MAYDSSKLALVSPAPLTGAFQKWVHQSADTGAQAQVAGFITDGGNRGMKVGDTVEHTNTSTNIVSLHRVMTVSAVAPGAVDLSNSTTIASGTNSD